jgi:valacyclovir hydrolase
VEPAEGFGPLQRLLDEPTERLLPLAAYLAEAYGPDRARAMAASWGGALRDIVAAGGDISLSRAGAITCPVLLVIGSDDPYCPVAAVRQLADAIPRSRLLELENVGHDVHLAAPGVLTTVVVDWLDDH